MKRIAIILALFSMFFACDNSVIKKPNHLISEKQMINMLYDIHLAEATYNKMRNDSIVRKSSSANFYYSILAKYEVADSVFEKSFVYYASVPKNFEKMYREVMTKLSETEQGFSGRKNDILKFETLK
jgi:peptide subunit release factor RF-3